MPFPNFIIAGTQKAGTTWLEHNLVKHPNVHTPKFQTHFFDKNYDKGLDWYRNCFGDERENVIFGEKTTEYFDTKTVEKVFSRIAAECPNTRILIILRDPVKRAMSALVHMVNSGLEPFPKDLDEILFVDQLRTPDEGYRYIERGFYAKQLEIVYKHIPQKNVFILIFEKDIISQPENGWNKVCDFLSIKNIKVENLDEKVNKLRLSQVAINASRVLYNVPLARNIIRRIDRKLGAGVWNPVFLPSTYSRLSNIYKEENKQLYSMLGYTIEEWDIYES